MSAARHALDRPVWGALSSRQAHLAQGDAAARRFDPDYALFVACADDTDASLIALADLIRTRGPAALLQAGPLVLPPGLTASESPGVQMVAEALTPAARPAFAVTALTDDDAPQMLALATLTQPGPFFSRTHQLGDFIGVKQDGVLVAMAGERLKLTGFTEVSGVCSHPGHRGRGYAGALLRIVAGRILARGETPFLHAYASNTAAITLYGTLGFRLRSEVTLTMLTSA